MMYLVIMDFHSVDENGHGLLFMFFDLAFRDLGCVFTSAGQI